MSALQVFSFEGKGVRAAVLADGEPGFVAKDVAEALGYVWKGVKGTMPHVPAEWQGVCSVQTPSGKQEMAALTEQGLYFFMGRSDKPKALPMQKWIAGEVLPAIRKTGTYSVAVPKTFAEALRLAADQQEVIERQAAALTLAEPKVEFVDRYVDGKGSVGFRELAKTLGAKEAVFRAFLVASRVLYKLGGNWVPYAYYLDEGFAVVKTGVGNYSKHVYKNTLFTPAGVERISKMWRAAA